MRAEIALADRRLEVRTAAADWEKAGVIDAEARRAIGELYRDDRVRMGWALRALLWFFTLNLGNSVFGFAGLVIGFEKWRLPALFGGLFFALMTEVQMARWRLRGFGTEEAAGQMAVAYLIGAAAGFLLGGNAPSAAQILALCAFAAILCAAAAWRWGGWIYGAAAAAALFFGLGQLSLARLLWIVAVLLILPGLLRGGVALRLAPSQRLSCDAAACAALAALYFAVHLVSFDHALIESMHWNGLERTAALPGRTLAILATALLPLAGIGLGLLRRRRLLLDAGLLALAVSLMTARVYLHLLPAWLCLAAGGALLMGAALAVRRFLDSRPGKELRGWTAEPLSGRASRAWLLEAAGAVIAFAPAARPVEREGFEGGGGESGGGGASGTF